jgi:hypothetical protein
VSLDFGPNTAIYACNLFYNHKNKKNVEFRRYLF